MSLLNAFEDFMNRIVYLPLSPDMAVDTASNMAEAVLQCAVERGRPGRRDPGSVGRT